ncbi:hypothetical protein [Mycobacterium lepromatosis]|uniref:hypothetical protein n=1 Tax=Mycobacterium lepromatosis TaxID=480418 RepID=UPI0012E0BD83|nr:hypothetical protein [Mycobacterium lepromatosis]
MSPILAFVFVWKTLIIEALPVIKFNGLHFFTATKWNPGNTFVSHDVAHTIGIHYGA